MVQEKLKGIFVELGITEEFNNEDNLYEIGFDSIKVMEMVVLIEEEFGIAIKDKDIIEENFVKVKNVLELINKYL